MIIIRAVIVIDGGKTDSSLEGRGVMGTVTQSEIATMRLISERMDKALNLSGKATSTTAEYDAWPETFASRTPGTTETT